MRGIGKKKKREGDEPEPDPKTTAAEDGDTPADRVAELEAECEELRTKWLRAQADYQNLRRRNQTEYELGLKRALHPLFSDLMLVADYLDMALAVEPTTDEAKNLAIGIEMTRTTLLQALENAEVHPVPTEGIFDPKQHETTGTEEREDAAAGTILNVVRKGYTWRETVLRHAHVTVVAEKDAPAEPNAEAAEAAEADAPEDTED